MPISLNGHRPLQYRIGTTDRVLGELSLAADGFLVLNRTNGKVFKSEGNMWVDGGEFPATLLAAWLGTTTTQQGIGYRIGNSERSLGAVSHAKEGFLVLNRTTGNVFKSEGGVWVVGGAFPVALLNAWLAA